MPTLSIVVTDANVLINLIHAERLGLLSQIPPYEFVVVEEVVAEITRPEQKQMLDDAVAAGHIRRVVIADIPALTLRTELERIMGLGEAASLALAVTQGWSVACDEKKVFLREARARVGQNRIMTTPGILLVAIRAGVITSDEADAIKALLETRRFTMSFVSFKDLL
ncbi:MAG: hypothetical protein KGJ79_18915 [Alphaproteobacteria bacterium]|nr:hypothetical protein [Alphaproteobacteria bacterium]MDE2113206.1 hypothetical protein [Alphaproteobacteria bacterium]MDE2494707.1 hypothetical protein [Alphaproteobacteria bacterium]